MATNTKDLPSTATDLIFVYGYYNLPGVSEAESVEYYPAAGSQGLRLDLARYIEDQLDLFTESSYEDYFSLGEYDSPENVIRAAEMPVFRSALANEDQQTALDELHPSDVLGGFRAVILQRIAAGNLADIHGAVKLFNYIIECGTMCVDDQDLRSYIRIGTAVEFGPWFIDKLLSSVESLDRTGRYDPYNKFVGKKFAPLKPVLDMLRPVVRSEAWPQNDVALGQFLLIVNYFKTVLLEAWQD